MTWHPLETAPKDGTRVLLYYPADDGEPAFGDVMSCDESNEVGRDFEFMIGGVDPTHWQPLPDPPEAA